jgi:uncharacterized damage-inducible protein DinB
MTDSAEFQAKIQMRSYLMDKLIETCKEKSNVKCKIYNGDNSMDTREELDHLLYVEEYISQKLEKIYEEIEKMQQQQAMTHPILK